MATVEKDVSNEVEFKNGRGNPFGWSQEEIWHDGKNIGLLYCGDAKLDAPGYRFTMTQEGEKKTRLTIYRAMDEEDWKATEFVKGYMSK